MRAELSKLGPILVFLIGLCIKLTVNGAALSILVGIGEMICSMLNLHPSIPYSMTRIIGADHAFAIPPRVLLAHQQLALGYFRSMFGSVSRLWQ